MQTLIPPDLLIAIATVLTHGVGSLTGVITPRFCNRSISSLNFNLTAACCRYPLGEGDDWTHFRVDF